MKKKYLWLFIGILLIPVNVFATSGRLRSSSIVSCNGQTYGAHGDGHWHVAVKQDSAWYASGGPLAGNPCGGNSYVAPSTPQRPSNYNSNNAGSYNNTNNSSSNTQGKVVSKSPVVESKSSDTSLKEIKIDDEVMPISDHLEYKTKNKKVKIAVVANDSKARIEYEQEKELKVGLNEYLIKVTAENGDVKNYNISITRIALSSNKEFKLFYDDEELTRNSVGKTIEDIYVSNDITNIAFEYKLSDTKSKITFTGNDKLKVGENEIKITIVAEDESKDVYTLNVHRNSKIGDLVETIIAYIIIFLLFALPIRIIIRKKKRKAQCNLENKGEETPSKKI